MPELSKEEMDRLLNQPIYSWDTSQMLGEVISFLEFSEENLAWQYRRELRKADEESKAAFPPGHEHYHSYRQHLLGNVEYGFDVSLSQRIRYAGLVAFLTTVEWFAKAMKRRLPETVSLPKEVENENINVLQYLNSRISAGFDERIADVRNLVYVRNCVVHAAGFVNEYRHGDALKHAVQQLRGFSIWEENYLGTSIKIERGAVDAYAKEASEWLPKLDQVSTERGILKP